MKPVSPVLPDQPESAAHEVKIAEEQPQYETLPALLVGRGPHNDLRYVSQLTQSEYIISRWQLTDEEIERLCETKELYFYQWNFGRAMQPVVLDTERPMAHHPPPPERPDPERADRDDVPSQPGRRYA